MLLNNRHSFLHLIGKYQHLLSLRLKRSSFSNIEVSTLSLEIELKRNEMIQNGLTNGFTDKKTIKLSQELNELLNLSIQDREIQNK
ncbi:aspartyl-phosphate phosphatase Spo0E family protein [Virgibacillus oceani]|uniref:aspartyl-phosphate phosphatase Spo0E family protein n=1 Tax=Virgibacillus oceani TaxID=1479511 RepID=UPI00166924C9|nr:aspartyl-phosphate phosphatase Spo0E family protein [Virgibacillus oceani]